MNVILLGPPGAGKGTMAALMTREMGIPQISTGDMLRANMARGTKLGEEARQYIERGDLVPDDVIIGMVQARLAESDCRHGYILDGFPRTVAQAEALAAFASIDCVINVCLTDEVIIARLSGRRVCPDCSGTFHVSRLADETVCPDCGGRLIQRKDDMPETIQNRLSVYARQTAPLIGFYREKGLIRDVDAAGTVEENYAMVKKALE